ncbi:MAG: Ig-like domain-containing protein [Candidatus Sumerlaeia bacterium]|nr:Ig-like domain-containing protein [Candidatus Sumerlaeia bacterium]
MRRFTRVHEFVVVFIFFVVGTLQAQADGPASLLLDINSQPAGSAPKFFARFDSVVFFNANTDLYGKELWKTDGTAAGTVLIKDIYPGESGSNPYNTVLWNGNVYFFAEHPTYGTELWKTDGTAAGTQLVKDINPSGWSPMQPSNLTPVNGTLFFSAYDIYNGTELWKTNGTAGGTQLVKDIYSGYSSSNPSNLTNVNGTLFFSATNGTNGVELWKSDGTEAGTVQVKDIRSGASGSSPMSLVAHNNKLYFAAYDGTNGNELWTSDGTEAGTQLVKDIRSGTSSSNPYGLYSHGGNIYFGADDGVAGTELWKSDGTAANTQLVKDINPGSGPSSPMSLATFPGGNLLFAANDGTNGSELWKTDGTAANTQLVKDINPGAASSNPKNFAPLPNASSMLFVANDATGNARLYKTNGLEDGTQLISVEDLIPNPDEPMYPHSASGKVFFQGSRPMVGSELWTSNGTASGTNLVKDLWPGTAHSNAANFKRLKSTTVFTADNGVNGNEPWQTGGLPTNTAMLKDVYPGPTGSQTYYWRVDEVPGTPEGTAPAKEFFSANHEATGRELYETDGTAAGTVPLADINPGTASSDPEGTAVWDGRDPLNQRYTAFLGAHNNTTGNEPYVYSDSLQPLGDLMPGPSGSYPYYFTPVFSPQGQTLWTGFMAFNSTNGGELWRTDGTLSGTQLVKDINPGSNGSYPTMLTNFNGSLVFAADDGTNGTELWKSDGTLAGTQMVKDINPGAIGSYPGYIIAQHGLPNFFFAADDGAYGTELWKSDGTAAGTQRIKDINPNPMSCSTPSDLTFVNNSLFFAANNGTNGMELWKSDGTDAGTQMVKDINPGSAGSYPTHLTNINGTLWFQANDGVHGAEPWFSNGTAAGTHMLQDVRNGADGSNPNEFAQAGRSLVFNANDGLHGIEPWYVPPSAPPQVQPLGAFSAGQETTIQVRYPTSTASSWYFECHTTKPPSGTQSVVSERAETPHVTALFKTLTITSPTLSGKFTGLADGKTYWYRGKVTDVYGLTSDWGPVTSSTQDGRVPTAPAQITDLGAFTSLTAVRFNWTAATDPGTTASGVASYELWVGTQLGGNNVFAGNVGNVLTRTVTGTNGQTLYARVRALDRAGNIGTWSPNSDGITIDQTRPRLSSASSPNNWAVTIVFNEPVRNADQTANVSINGGARIFQSQRQTDQQYRLHTSTLSPNTSYTVTARVAIKDRAGNALDPAYSAVSFRTGARTDVQEWMHYR